MLELLISKIQSDIVAINESGTLETNSMYYGSFFATMWVLRELGHETNFKLSKDNGLKRVDCVTIDNSKI